jgi:hypothetical protein
MPAFLPLNSVVRVWADSLAIRPRVCDHFYYEPLAGRQDYPARRRGQQSLPRRIRAHQPETPSRQARLDLLTSRIIRILRGEHPTFVTVVSLFIACRIVGYLGIPRGYEISCSSR